jgi:CBS domain containing-hemolysin-like protein
MRGFIIIALLTLGFGVVLGAEFGVIYGFGGGLMCAGVLELFHYWITWVAR